MNSPLKLITILAFCFAVVQLSSKTVTADFPELLKQIPASANALIVIKTKDIENKATMANKREIHSFAEAARFWPALKSWQPERLVMAAELDIQHMHPLWEMAAIEFAKEPNLGQLAKSTDGVTDKLLDHDVIWLDNACILATGKNQLTLVTPLNRQSATRWLRRIKNQDSIQLSPFLADVADTATVDATEITVAVDLENIFPPAQVGEAVKKSKLFKEIETDPTKILVSVRGVVLKCRVNAEEMSAINVEFGEAVDSLAPIAKRMMINAMAKAGAMPSELGGWKATATGKQISLQGSLSASALKRVLSIASIGAAVAHSDAAAIEQPSSPSANTDEGQAAAAEFERLQVVRATKKYLKSVTDEVAEIEKQMDRTSLEQNALWINNSARKIEQLSTRRVDEEMVSYGQYVAKTLRSLVGIYHEADDEVRANMAWTTPVFGGRTVTNVPIPVYNRGGYRRMEYAPMVSQNLNLGYARQERRAVRDTGRFEANKVARDVLAKINDATSQIRDMMSKKYNEPF